MGTLLDAESPGLRDLSDDCGTEQYMAPEMLLQVLVYIRVVVVVVGRGRGRGRGRARARAVARAGFAASDRDRATPIGSRLAARRVSLALARFRRRAQPSCVLCVLFSTVCV